MATNYYGAEQTKMADYGYGDDDPYSFGGYSATQQPSAGGMDNETQRRRSPTAAGLYTPRHCVGTFSAEPAQCVGPSVGVLGLTFC